MASPNIDDIAIVKELLNHPLPEPSAEQKTAEQEWRERASKMTALNLKAIEPSLAELDAHLTLRSYISGYTLSRADLVVWGVLRSNRVAHAYIKNALMVNLARWFTFIEQSEAWVAEAVLSSTASKMSINDAPADEGASYDIGLQDTSKGVVTRFPPEPSGYLHIGHAKAALLNDYFAHKKYNGTLYLRFDDTNPSKEKQEFEDSQIQDLHLMGIVPDKTTHTSDYFQELHDYCVQMIKEGKAYADDTPREEIKKERELRLPNKHRDDSPEDSLARFEAMKSGSEEGQKWFIRAKIAYDSPNGTMRDPAIYRCNPQSHHRTGNQWKVYPTYDFACPIVDAMEGVTHALRTTEYNERDEQYQWMLKALRLRHVYNWDFSRLNMIRTLLSKRKLTQFVNEGVVWGWDDPRMPTIRGIHRRGMTIPALQEYILKQGPSKNTVLQDWTSFWATNKRYIDPIAARYTALDSQDIVPLTIHGARTTAYSEDKPRHAKHPLGMKKVTFSSNCLLEQADAQQLEQDEEVTLMNWGNAIVRKISHSLLPVDSVNPLSSSPRKITGVEMELHLQGDVKTTKKKLTWLSKDGQELIPVELYDFDYLITKDKLDEGDDVDEFVNKHTITKTEALADCNVAELKEGDIMQFDRKGYFRVDKPFLHGEPARLFNIPTGKTK